MGVTSRWISWDCREFSEILRTFLTLETGERLLFLVGD